MFFPKEYTTTKKITIENDVIGIIPISPKKFLDTEEGIPFSIFEIKKVKTMYEKTLEGIGSLKETIDIDSEKFLENIKLIFSKCALTINGGEFKPDKYIEENDMISVTYLLCSIFAISFNKFDSILEVSEKQPIFWDAMAKRYGKSPIDCLFPNGGYSDMDAYCFNTMVLHVGMETENSIINKVLAKMKRGKK